MFIGRQKASNYYFVKNRGEYEKIISMTLYFLQSTFCAFSPNDDSCMNDMSIYFAVKRYCKFRGLNRPCIRNTYQENNRQIA